MQRKKWMFALLAILPTLLVFAYVRIYPIGDTLRLSLHKWDILSKNKPFIGLANFEELTGDPLFKEALFNTTIIAFGVLLITIPLGLVLAALIYHRTRSRLAGFYEAAIFIPHVVSLVPAAMARHQADVVKHGAGVEQFAVERQPTADAGHRAELVDAAGMVEEQVRFGIADVFGDGARQLAVGNDGGLGDF